LSVRGGGEEESQQFCADVQWKGRGPSYWSSVKGNRNFRTASPGFEKAAMQSIRKKRNKKKKGGGKEDRMGFRERRVSTRRKIQNRRSTQSKAIR